jgi:hypothetical protein
MVNLHVQVEGPINQRGFEMSSLIARVLILCKTYPSPSAKYSETSCVAGLTDQGQLIRLFPVPFRLISDEQQFRKWQWIEARVEKSREDHRPESHRVFIDTINVEAEPMQAGKKGWPLRMALLDKAPCFDSFEAMEEARIATGLSLALLKPSRIVKLEIEPAKENAWSAEEIAKLERWQQQDGLFDEDAASKDVKLLEKLPFDFYYQCEFDVGGEPQTKRIKLVDWEVGALYRNLRRQHGIFGWEHPFRQKYELELPSKDLRLMMGTAHRFPHQWLGVSVFYPPKPQREEDDQGSLF